MMPYSLKIRRRVTSRSGDKIKVVQIYRRYKRVSTGERRYLLFAEGAGINDMSGLREDLICSSFVCVRLRIHAGVSRCVPNSRVKNAL